MYYISRSQDKGRKQSTEGALPVSESSNSSFSTDKQPKGKIGLEGRGKNISMQQNAEMDVVSDTLDFFRERNDVQHVGVPKAFLAIKEQLLQVRNEDKKLLIRFRDSYDRQKVKISLDYIGDRWALGYSTVQRGEERIDIPYTIHYSDIYCQESQINVTIQGESPYGS